MDTINDDKKPLADLYSWKKFYWSKKCLDMHKPRLGVPILKKLKNQKNIGPLKTLVSCARLQKSSRSINLKFKGNLSPSLKNQLNSIYCNTSLLFG